MSRTFSIYPYKAGPIEPVAIPGEVVGIWVNKQFSFYKIVYVEGIMRSNPIVHNFGAIAAGANTGATPQQFALIDMPGSSANASDAEFGQFRAHVVDDVEVILYQGRADQRHKTDIRVAVYNLFNRLTDPDGHEGEFYVFGNDNHAFGQAFNVTDYNLTQARIAFWGYRYVVQYLPQFTLSNQPDAWTRIPATAHL